VGGGKLKNWAQNFSLFWLKFLRGNYYFIQSCVQILLYAILPPAYNMTITNFYYATNQITNNDLSGKLKHW
jgi:hypothetical protein